MSRMGENLYENLRFLDGIFEIVAVEYFGVIQMKNMKQKIIQGIVMGLFLPAVLVAVVLWQGRKAPNTSVTTATQSQQTQTTDPMPTACRVPVLLGEERVTMELEEYLLGVLLAEMPASFETEAIKAQAVASRTFALWNSTISSNHEPYAICTDATCCQGYLSPLRYIQQGGSNAQLEKIRSAVKDTEGEVICYEGELILATYFSCSGGITEDALAVWGQEYPYLQSVESPGEENAAYFTDEKRFDLEEFSQALDVSLTGVPGSWIGVITYTNGGGVKTIDICGTTFTGTQIRSKLGLRSTSFTLAVSEQGVTVHTRGYGHRVGMSQYGADAMAIKGSDYQQILRHYYPGTSVQAYRQNK